MPSLPTSLIIVGLVAAWLVVLVPMVAKRREHVPESDEDSAGFRILRRTSAAKRRPVLSRTAMAGDEDVFPDAGDFGDQGYVGDEDSVGDEDPVGDEAGEWDDDIEDHGAGADVEDDTVRGAEPVGEDDAELVGENVAAVGEQADVQAVVDGDDVRGSNYVRVDPRRGRGSGRRDSERVTAQRGGQDELPYEDVRSGEWDSGEPGRGDARRRRAERVPAASARHRPEPGATYGTEDTYGTDDPYQDERETQWRREPVGAGRPVTRARRSPQRPVYDERLDYDGRPDYDERADDRGDYDRGDYDDRRPSSDWDDPGRYRPVPVRPGRGGFDPQAAERAKAYRYRQRRRIVLTLLVVAALATGAGLLGFSLAWAAVAVAAVLLALYLAYLRRQVRIEEDIRRRRAARLERARQIRPVYRASVAEQVRAHRTGSLRRPEPDEEPVADYRVVSHARPSVPPQYQTRGVPVDLDDDDPAFDNLEYYRAMPYRRAVGE